MITEIQFLKAFPYCKTPQEWLSAMDKILPENEINTPMRIAAFIAQCGHESAGWSTFEENLNYSAEALNLVFPSHFKDVGRDASEYARQPEKIANVVYANRMGNGDISSGDGWKYRGRGPIQITGKDNYSLFSQAFPDLMENPLDNPDVVKDDVQTSLKSALWFWNSHHLNYFSDKGDIKGQTRIINGGYNGLKDRITLFNEIKGFLTGTGAIINSSPSEPIDSSNFNSLRLGSKGEGVKVVQKILGLSQDGDFGPKTELAVENYQRLHNLIPDGIVGPKTFDQMLGKDV